MGNEIDKLFIRMQKMGGSDLHLSEGSSPMVRVHGHLERLEDVDKLTRKVMISWLQAMCPPDRWKHFTRAGELDFAYTVGNDELRLRANLFLKEVGIGAVFRTIPTEVATLDELGAPKVLRTLAETDRGLVLVTGPTGSGKSTTLAAMIDHINRNHAKRILTIEEPIEFVHQSRKSVLVQREVGFDTPSFEIGLRSAARMDFDVILVGEMRDYETISAAVTAAELGILVFGTLHTNSAAKAIDRILDVFPVEQQPQVRSQLSESLRGVCAQTLLRKRDGNGRIAAHEILVRTPAVKNAIREGKMRNVISAMQSGKAHGMRLMDDCIDEILGKGLISRDEAYSKAIDKSRFLVG